jgi:hypothetical protein
MPGLQVAKSGCARSAGRCWETRERDGGGLTIAVCAASALADCGQRLLGGGAAGQGQTHLILVLLRPDRPAAVLHGRAVVAGAGAGDGRGRRHLHAAHHRRQHGPARARPLVADPGHQSDAGSSQANRPPSCWCRARLRQRRLGWSAMLPRTAGSSHIKGWRSRFLSRKA